LLHAINLFFREDVPVSIHTLSEAATQVLSDIGGKYGVKSMLRENDLIRADKKKEWLRHVFKSRNFFKHAKTDREETHEFKTEFNEFSLLDGVTMYSAIKRQWVPETLVFQIWFMRTHPDLIKEDSDLSAPRCFEWVSRLAKYYGRDKMYSFSLHADLKVATVMRRHL
jgi:hypothetical protein